MRKQSNRMFSSRSGMELKGWLPCRQEWSLGRWLGYVSQSPPSEGSHQAGPLCYGGCTASHRALLLCVTCNSCSSFLLKMLLQFCLPPSWISSAIPLCLPSDSRNCPHLPQEASSCLQPPQLHLASPTSAPATDSLLPSVCLDSKSVAVTTHHLSWNRLMDSMAQSEIHRFHQVVSFLGDCCFLFC